MCSIQVKIAIEAICDAISHRFKGVELLVFASLLLSGCAHYDVGIQFDSQTHGVIVQHIRLGERLTTSSGPSAQQWLAKLEKQAEQWGAQVKRPSKGELSIWLPFNNGTDLSKKFNHLLGSGEVDSLAQTLGLPDIPSHLSISQRNWIIVLRNHLTYDLDLRGVGSLLNLSNGLIEGGGLLDLEFSLITPWGVTPSPSSQPPQNPGRVQVWSLKPGQLNHIEVFFWLPSPIGIGTMLILLLVMIGRYLKYGLGSPSPGNSVLRRRPGKKVNQS